MNQSDNSSAEYQLVLSAREGNSDAFEDLCKQYTGFLKHYLSSLNVPQSEREDLTQEGLIGLLKAIRSFDNISASFSTYAILCIKRSIITALRKYHRQSAAELLAEPQTALADTGSPSPEAFFLDKESAGERYKSFISSFSVFEKSIFDFYIKGISYREMALRLNCSIKSVNNALCRIRLKIKKCHKNL